MIADLKGIPQKPNPDKVGIYIPTRIMEKASGGGASGSSALGGDAEGLPMPAEIPEPLTRRMPITHKEIEKYGFTEGRPGCQAKQRGEIARRGHSEKCRRRIEEAMRNDEEGKRKMEKTDERITHKLARDLEKGGE